MALNSPEYWLEKYLQEASCGSRHRVGVMLAAQLRDNEVPKQTAKDTLRQYAKQVPSSSGDAYTEKEALQTVRWAYKQEKREPCAPESDDGTNVDERARERERELLRAFKRNPLSLDRMERKRLKESDVHNLPLRIYEIELAKQHMTREERGHFKYCRNTDKREYSAEGHVEPFCENAEFVHVGGDSFRPPRTKMTVELDEAMSEALRDMADKMIRIGLERRQNFVDGQK